MSLNGLDSVVKGQRTLEAGLIVCVCMVLFVGVCLLSQMGGCL